MKTNLKKGFTLIELLVVIVIIGILATIGVATFQGYFAKARDTERQAAIRNASTVMKTAIAVGTVTNVPADMDTYAEVDTILSSEAGYAMPADATGYEFRLLTGDTGTANAGEFAFFVCGEENRSASEIFVDGTAAAIAAVNAATATALCPTAGTTVAVGAADTAIGANWTTAAQ